MRNTMSMTRRVSFIAAALAAVAAVFLMSPNARAQNAQPAENIEQMIRSPKTAADHEAIASYYDREAAQSEDKARLHLDMANIYAKPGMAAHCRNLVKDFRLAANEDKELAKGHREMAHNLEH
jgi:hypothetical protein